MKARTVVDVEIGPTYGLRAGTLVIVEPHYELPWFDGVRYRVTDVPGNVAARSIIAHEGLTLDASMIEEV